MAVQTLSNIIVRLNTVFCNNILQVDRAGQTFAAQPVKQEKCDQWKLDISELVSPSANSSSLHYSQVHYCTEKRVVPGVPLPTVVPAKKRILPVDKVTPVFTLKV